MSSSKRVAVVGGGPAGLMAAQVAAECGLKVTLYEAKRSVGRKFLVAGKSGLNLTNDSELETFISNYHSPSAKENQWEHLISKWSNTQTREWAKELGIETFVSSGKKVFPTSLKAAPLLRRWIEHLRQLGVEFKVNHQLIHIASEQQVELGFDTPSGSSSFKHDHVVLALGGGSWPQTGSTGGWVPLLESLGVQVSPLTAANCGWHVDWPPAILKESEGLPIKNTVFTSNNMSLEGEAVITSYGIEGGPIYKLGPEIRKSNLLHLDFKPTFTKDELLKKMESVKRNILHEARHRLKLSTTVISILEHCHNGSSLSKQQLIDLVKCCPITCSMPRPLEESISSAGGVSFNELDNFLCLKSRPNISFAGEMLDWEAPTGGYLLQGCFATARCSSALFKKIVER